MAYDYTNLTNVTNLVELVVETEKLSCSDFTCNLGTKLLLIIAFFAISGVLIQRQQHPAESVLAAGFVCTAASLFLMLPGLELVTELWPFTFACITGLAGVGVYLNR